MSMKILRGRVLSFLRRPQSIKDTEAYLYLEDGGVAIGDDGKILHVGDFAEISEAYQCPIIDHRPYLISAGFVDPHMHFVQMQVVGSYAANLLEWLNTYTFVEEQRFEDPQHGSRIASAFFDELIRNGTTTAAAFCSVHAASADVYFGEAQKRNMAMIGGKVMMDRNCPPALQDSAQTGYDNTKTMIERWHGVGRNHCAITPRFAITSSPEQLDAAKALHHEFPDLHIQTHLSENDAEIAFTAELYPEHKDYLAVYEHYDLLGPKSLFGHSIHLSERELGAMAETRSVAVSCPTSNLFLGSGLYDLARADEAGMRSAVATDIGGGTSYSMLATMDEFYKVQQMKGNRLDPLTSYYMATSGNAAALSLDHEIGCVGVGHVADLVVLDAGATPSMAIKMERVESLVEELFLLQTLGDDRAIAETYVCGVAMKSKLSD